MMYTFSCHDTKKISLQDSSIAIKKYFFVIFITSSRDGGHYGPLDQNFDVLAFVPRNNCENNPWIDALLSFHFLFTLFFVCNIK